LISQLLELTARDTNCGILVYQLLELAMRDTIVASHLSTVETSCVRYVWLAIRSPAQIKKLAWQNLPSEFWDSVINQEFS
jgi:hypothetical protein